MVDWLGECEFSDIDLVRTLKVIKLMQLKRFQAKFIFVFLLGSSQKYGIAASNVENFSITKSVPTFILGKY